jgi:hypothetical protein
MSFKIMINYKELEITLGKETSEASWINGRPMALKSEVIAEALTKTLTLSQEAIMVMSEMLLCEDDVIYVDNYEYYTTMY